VQNSVAPMMDWTDNHYRTLARLISKHAWLYTEMVVADTLNHQQDNLVSSSLSRPLLELHDFDTFKVS
jgi:tRNA-dihydrouridine synthase